MQLTRSKNNFIERVCRDANGRLVRATFCVYENNGHIKARLLKIEYIKENQKIESKPLILSLLTPSVSKYEETGFNDKIFSPFFTLNILYFFGSKPRAPTA